MNTKPLTDFQLEILSQLDTQEPMLVNELHRRVHLCRTRYAVLNNLRKLQILKLVTEIQMGWIKM